MSARAHTHTNTHTHVLYTNIYHKANIILAKYALGHETKTTIFLVKMQLDSK